MSHTPSTSAPHMALPSRTPLSESAVASLLQELLDDCFQAALDEKSLCAPRQQYVANFHKYLHDLHCHENLSFIIEIYRYEYFYGKIYPENVDLQRLRAAHTRSSSCLLNTSLEQFIDSLPFPTNVMRRNVSKPPSLAKQPSATGSEASFVLDHALFDFDFDHSTKEPADAWDVLKNQHIASDSENSSLASAGLLDSLDQLGLLHDQWAAIVLTFIYENSPQQINLCNKTYREIVDLDEEKDVVHSPLVLVKAKLEVIQLLRENAYSSFVASQRGVLDDCECNGSCANYSFGQPKSEKPPSCRSAPTLTTSATHTTPA